MINASSLVLVLSMHCFDESVCCTKFLVHMVGMLPWRAYQLKSTAGESNQLKRLPHAKIVC